MPDHFIKSVKLSQVADEKYPGRGDTSLYDLQSANPYTQSKAWLGFQGKPIDFVIDLGKIEEVEEIAIGSFTNVLAWVFPLRRISCSTSIDGKSFSATTKQSFPEGKAGAPVSIDYFRLKMEPRQARYVKVAVKSQPKNPEWHASPGEPSWLFVDEVLVW